MIKFKLNKDQKEKTLEWRAAIPVVKEIFGDVKITPDILFGVYHRLMAFGDEDDDHAAVKQFYLDAFAWAKAEATELFGDAAIEHVFDVFDEMFLDDDDE